MRWPSDISPLMAGVAVVVDGDDGGELLVADHLFELAPGSLGHEEALDAVVQADADRLAAARAAGRAEYSTRPLITASSGFTSAAACRRAADGLPVGLPSVFFSVM